ncbi:uncharacterized protein B0H18DRAFT_966884 [Fomitopsis serialis]|uniref:uncharacterized protein n=1 Tax=Fomitopsis serialis TaxID=139415 RepID=UPI002008CD38|nr:uncharacterized protein B0H18DRAFT_966884 [Neoantrodia serialis]KAH9938385.1 hypothetical protein B0H18DRAFT_966884 [Neoantrodia serialis]
MFSRNLVYFCSTAPLRNPVVTPPRAGPAALWRAYASVTISDPPRTPNSASTLSAAHPRDPRNPDGSSSSSTSSPGAGPSNAPELVQPAAKSSSSPPPPNSDPLPPVNEPDANASEHGIVPAPPPSFASSPPCTDLPAPHFPSNAHTPTPYSNPPFHTHKFVESLEVMFPTVIAQNLMCATRALLVDRLGRVRRDAVTAKDLFKAALSELRTETTMLTRNDTAAIRTATGALRREVDVLDVRMKEDIGTLKHEYVFLP